MDMMIVLKIEVKKLCFVGNIINLIYLHYTILINFPIFVQRSSYFVAIIQMMRVMKV